jgi:transcriptional regulator with XRE-family HTH domain
MEHEPPPQDQDNETGISEVDRHVSARLRALRTMRGLTQQYLAAALGISSQQMHKYECAHSRIPAGRLYELARALKVPLTSFFEGLDQSAAEDRYDTATLEVARNFASISNRTQQKAFAMLARMLAEKADGAG